MRIIAAIAVVTLIAAIAQPASAGMVGDCNQSADPDLQMGGCTAVIQSGEISGRHLAIAYNSRGTAYGNQGRYRRAIADYDEAIRINPGYAIAYQNRGVTYESLGDFERAASDWEQAIRVDGASRATWWQDYMKGKGLYAGAVDGIFGPATRRALLACAIDPAC